MLGFKEKKQILFCHIVAKPNKNGVSGCATFRNQLKGTQTKKKLHRFWIVERKRSSGFRSISVFTVAFDRLSKW